MAEKAEKIDSHNNDFIYFLTTVYINTGKFEKAIAVNDRVIDQTPELAVKAYLELGRIYRTTGEFDKAISSYRQALDLDPQDEDIYYFLGYCYRIMGDYEKSVEEICKYAHMKPETADKHLEYSDALSIVGRYAESIAECKLANALEPNKWEQLVLSYFSAGRAMKAIEYAEQSMKIYEPSHWFKFWLAQLYMYQTQYEKSVQFMQKYVSKGKFVQEEQCYKSTIQTDSFDKTNTQKYYQCILNNEKQTDPSLLRWPVSRAVIYSSCEDKDNAFRLLLKAFNEKDGQLAKLIKMPFFDNLKSDPRYVDLIRKLKLEKYVHLHKK